jgi:hypothetical protein
MKLFVLFLASMLFAVCTFALDPPKDLDVGVYFAHGADLKELPVEIVNWKSGGVLKYAFTEGIVKGDFNGRIQGGESRIALSDTSNVEIFIRTVEGVSAEEYQLIRLRQHSGAREFRSVTGGVFHVSGGATRDLVPFTARKVGQRLWRIVLINLPMGEYGFLPPVNTASLAASGKIYSFQVSPERFGSEASTSAVPVLPQRSALKSLLWPAGDTN